MSSFDYIQGSATTFMAQRSWAMDIWLNMMAESFKGIDVEREYLAKNGSWTAKTTSLERYSHIDFYA